MNDQFYFLNNLYLYVHTEKQKHTYRRAATGLQEARRQA